MNGISLGNMLQNDPTATHDVLHIINDAAHQSSDNQPHYLCGLFLVSKSSMFKNNMNSYYNLHNV